NDPPLSVITPLSLHDALPICTGSADLPAGRVPNVQRRFDGHQAGQPPINCLVVWSGHVRSSAPSPPKANRHPAKTTVVSSDYGRSEEHTSELQSRGHLVCRLL